MATAPANPPQSRAELLAFMRESRKRRLESRERVLEAAANLGRISEELRALERRRRRRWFA